MSLISIRKTYGVPAYRGRRVKFTPNGSELLASEGVIVGSKGQYLRIRMGNETKAGTYHPTYELTYF